MLKFLKYVYISHIKMFVMHELELMVKEKHHQMCSMYEHIFSCLKVSHDSRTSISVKVSLSFWIVAKSKYTFAFACPCFCASKPLSGLSITLALRVTSDLALPLTVPVHIRATDPQLHHETHRRWVAVGRAHPAPINPPSLSYSRITNCHASYLDV